jgi:hypothetical protein
MYCLLISDFIVPQPKKESIVPVDKIECPQQQKHTSLMCVFVYNVFCCRVYVRKLFERAYERMILLDHLSLQVSYSEIPDLLKVLCH